MPALTKVSVVCKILAECRCAILSPQDREKAMTKMSANDKVIGTVKGPGLLPHEYLFLTRDNRTTRIGEFVYYAAEVDGEVRHMIGTIKGRSLNRGLPDAFLAEANIHPADIASMLGIEPDPEIYQITVETIGYFSKSLGNFVNPRIAPTPGDRVMVASGETLAEMLSLASFLRPDRHTSAVCSRVRRARFLSCCRSRMSYRPTSPFLLRPVRANPIRQAFWSKSFAAL